jgi:Beta-ketoacyl synthase, N-terminal domain
MFFIHHTSCISPQQSFGEVDLDQFHVADEGKMRAVEPEYANIPAGALRRMGKAVRMGVGAGLPLLVSTPQVEGIIIGTANGGMEDCIKFLNQIIEYDEGQLTPGNFVQSTPNAIAAQIGFINRNRGYNVTHVQRGLAFESALMDAIMQLSENPGTAYLVGAIEEISTYNYNIDWLDGWYKKEKTEAADLYSGNTTGSIAGEGASLFYVNDNPENAVARLVAVDSYHSNDPLKVAARWQDFLEKNRTDNPVDILISGENGDTRLLPFYQTIEETLDDETGILRFKHASGEYPTASAFALWLACRLLARGGVPEWWFKKQRKRNTVQTIAIYNNFKNQQHGFMLVQLPAIVE